jgi:hypothetical protein
LFSNDIGAAAIGTYFLILFFIKNTVKTIYINIGTITHIITEFVIYVGPIMVEGI